MMLPLSPATSPWWLLSCLRSIQASSSQLLNLHECWLLSQALALANRSYCTQRWKELSSEDPLYYEKALTIFAQWYQPHKVPHFHFHLHLTLKQDIPLFQHVSLKHICQTLDRFAREATSISASSKQLIGHAINEVLFEKIKFK